MFDAGCRYETPLLQRAEGTLAARFRWRDGVTVLERLHQGGCLKACFPRPAAGGWKELVSVNSSGGIAAGDRLTAVFAASVGARVTISALAAERWYRAGAGNAPAILETRISVAPGAALEWLPQQAIIYDGAAVSRRLEIDLAADASFLGIEMLVFGRALMGESVHRLKLRDRAALRRDGVLLLHDAIRIDGDAAALLARSAIAAGMRAVATLIYAANDAEDRLGELRAVLDQTEAEAGASAENGLLVARLLAVDGAALRRSVETVLFAMRGRPAPRVWLC